MGISEDLESMAKQAKRLTADYGEDRATEVLNEAIATGRTDVYDLGKELLGEPEPQVITRENLASRLSQSLGFQNEGEDNYRKVPGGFTKLEE